MWNGENEIYFPNMDVGSVLQLNFARQEQKKMM